MKYIMICCLFFFSLVPLTVQPEPVTGNFSREELQSVQQMQAAEMAGSDFQPQLFTEEELSYIQGSPVLLVGMKTDRLVMSYYHEATGYGGINYDIMQAISQISGLTLDYLALSNGKTHVQAIHDGDCDLSIAFFDFEGLNDFSDIRLSNKLFENSMEMIIKANTDLTLSTISTIVIPKSANALKQYIKEHYPQSAVIYAPADKRADYVLRNKADATIIGRYEANYIFQMPRYRMLRILPTNIVVGSCSIGMKGNQDPRLLSIINKSIAYLLEHKLEEILYHNTIVHRYEYTFRDILSLNIINILAVICLGSLIITLFIVKENKQMIQLKTAAEEANTSKTAFLSKMSHDMRTPLSAVIGLADFGKAESTETEVKNYFSQIKDNSEYLLSLINEILDMQRIESGELTLKQERVGWGTIEKKVEAMFQPEIRDHRIQFTLELDEQQNLVYLADSVRTEQILVNLVNNAIRYTMPEGCVSWKVNKERLQNGILTIEHVITDTGVGMSKDFQKKMFEPFTLERNSLTDKESGTGLGLAITRQLVEAMGGTIFCESDIGCGTTFFVRLHVPVAPEDPVKKYPSDHEIMHSCKGRIGKRILLCEDNAVNQMIAKKILEELGFVVEIAENGEAGVEKALNASFDAILMDIRMPVMDGLTATKNIRKQLPDIPIIGLSANAYPEDIENSLNAGMNEHLCKPIDKLQLCRVLHKLLCKDTL